MNITCPLCNSLLTIDIHKKELLVFRDVWMMFLYEKLTKKKILDDEKIIVFFDQADEVVYISKLVCSSDTDQWLHGRMDISNGDILFDTVKYCYSHKRLNPYIKSIEA